MWNRERRRLAVAFGLFLIASTAFGWGTTGHKLITRKAADAMPEPVRAFFLHVRSELADHSIDPDVWRKMDDPQYEGEGANHYIDIDYEKFGRFPFTELPRDRAAAVEKFGAETFEKYGKLPWRIAEYLDEVTEAMKSGDPDRIVGVAGAFSHYVEDAHQPLHAVMNYDGQLTNQRGIHGLWEWNMVNRYARELEVSVVPDITKVRVIDDPLDAAFEIVLDSYAAHFALLNADRRARAGIDGDLEESDAYFERLWAESGELARRQMSAAATWLASFWLTAWERAGRPELPLPGDAKTGVRPRARDLGIRIGRLEPGPLNAITDVAGVKVGHVTVRFGDGPNAARTGVTAIVPREDVWHRKVSAATYTFNGNGAMTGAHWVNEAGRLEVPILLTGTLNVPRVANGVVSWMAKVNPKMGRGDDVVLPFVAECSDAWLTDAQARYVTEEHVIQAIETAQGGPVAEGSVGAGTGMISYSFKGGIGTSSRVVDGFTVGVLVLANGGRRPELRIDGVPVGEYLTDRMPQSTPPDGSFLIVVATDAPLTSRQLRRIAKRATFGLARTGTVGRHGSGDFVVAFSTATEVPHFPEEPTYSQEVLEDSKLTPLFAATVEATEEAIVNALVAGETMIGRDGHTVYAMPLDRLREVMYRHSRLAFDADEPDAG